MDRVIVVLCYSVFLVSKKVKVAHTRLPSVGFRSWSRFLAVSLQVIWVINPAVGCHYFLPGLQLPPQPLRGLLPILLVNRGAVGVNSLPKTVTRQRRDCDLNPGLFCACVSGRLWYISLFNWSSTVITAADITVVRCPDFCLSPVRFCLTTTSRCGRCNQGRLNQWAHWAFAQDPRIFFSFWGAPNWLWWNNFLNNYLIVDATAWSYKH